MPDVERLHESNVLRGKPRIKNTRIPVALVIGYLADTPPTRS